MANASERCEISRRALAGGVLYGGLQPSDHGPEVPVYWQLLSY